MNIQHEHDKRHRTFALVTAAVFAIAAAAALLDRTGPSSAPVLPAAGFTGEIAPEGPVYRLAPINVVVSRKVELARVEREEQLDRAREVRAHIARKPDA